MKIYNFTTDNEFIIINNNIVIINLNKFYCSEQFSHKLLDFIGKFCRTYNGGDYQVLNLEFTNGFKNFSIVFLYPFVDKSISFKYLYQTYALKYNSVYICLYIKKN